MDARNGTGPIEVCEQIDATDLLYGRIEMCMYHWWQVIVQFCFSATVFVVNVYIYKENDFKFCR